MKRKRPGRYATSPGPEGQFEPGSGGRVLRNRLGIRSKRTMDRVEYEALVRVQADYLERITAQTRFTAAMICRMHRDWLGDIYGWAGEYRSVELAKGNFRWPPAFRVGSNMERFEHQGLHVHTPCRAGPLDNVARRIAEVHGELMLIHPFRDGNGRLGRWLADLMAFQAGFPAPSPAFGFSGRGSMEHRRRYIEAVATGYLGNYEDLAAFFALAIEARLRDAQTA